MSEILSEKWNKLAFAKDSTTVLVESQDESAFMTKIAHAAVDGEEKVIIGDKEYDVDMDKEAAEEITGEKAKDEKVEESLNKIRSTIRALVLEVCDGCEEEMMGPVPMEDEEVEQQVVEPVLDMILAPAPIDIEPHMEDEGRMFDYGHTKSDSWEGKMTKAKLHRMSQMAQSLHDRMEDQDDLPEWLNNHVTTAEDRLRSAYDYMDYKLHRMAEEESPCGETIAISLEEIE